MKNNNNIKLNETQIKVIKDFKVPENAIVDTYYQGDNFIDVRYSVKPYVEKIKRINKDWYYLIKTGEYKEYARMDKDAQQRSKVSALKRTFNDLRMLIRTNFTDSTNNQLFITLTYAQEGREQPTHKELYVDFKKFVMRLKTHLKHHKLEYIVVFEPQGNGWFHCHMMLKSTNQERLYIHYDTLNKLWGLGMTETERLKSTDVGSYYTAYFTDLLLDVDNNTSEKVKGGRLHFYPKGFKFYRCSRGIERPTKKKELLRDIPKEFTKVFEKSYQIDNTNKITGETKKVNIHYKATYKKNEVINNAKPKNSTSTKHTDKL